MLTATRSLAATPVPVVAAVLAIAVAVGVNLAVLGLIDRAMLSPAAHVVAPERLFTIGIVPPGAKPLSPPMTSTSYVAFTSIRDQVPAIQGAAAFTRTETSVVVNAQQQAVRSMTVSGEVLRRPGNRADAWTGHPRERGFAVDGVDTGGA